MTEVTGQGVGARVRRKEDARFLRGRGNYVSDMILPGQSEVAFLRSPIAHGRIRRIAKPPGSEGRVFVRADLAEAAAMIAPTTVPGYKLSEWHPLAHDKVRFVGEPVAMCVAPTRAEAEDLTEQVEVEFDELPGAGRRARRARREDRPRARAMGRQSVPHAEPRQRLRRQRQGRAGRGQARALAEPPGDGADGRQGDPGPLGRAQRPARRLLFDPGAACRPRGTGAVPRHRPGSGAGDLARRRRRLRLQGHRASRGAVRRLAGAQVSPAVPLYRGPARASGGRRQYAPASLPAHRARRRTRPAAGARRRDHHRRRRLFQLAVHGRRSSRGRRPAICRAPTISAATAARPIASRPTSPVFCPTAAWPAPASALRWS